MLLMKLRMKFSLFSRELLIGCEVSLPQNVKGFFCKVERDLELHELKKIWKVKKDPSGFALLDMPNWELTAGSFLHPFTRHYIDGYIKTVILSKSSDLVYRLVKKNFPSEFSYYYYKTLSEYFEMIAILGGVSIML